MTQKRATVLGIFILTVALVGAMPVGAGVATIGADGDAVVWHPQVADYAGMLLTISGPAGDFRRDFRVGETPSFSLFDDAGFHVADGSYAWEIRVTPRMDGAALAQNRAARELGLTSAAVGLRGATATPEGGVESGFFTVKDGAAIVAGQTETRAAGGSATGASTAITAADQVIADDLIVQGSACIGLDCVNNESFGFDTIRMKENNTRIKFQDTSVGSFPTQDWQLTANDSASGGSNKFSIEAITPTANVPFTIVAGAASNSIFVSSSSRVGLRTSTPVLDLHINTSNTPGIRLEQNSSGGFSAQSWDIAGNESNFFIRDVTNGSRLPLRIRPGAPTSSIDISASGNVGIGTASPSTKLVLSGQDGGSGNVQTSRYENSGTGVTWFFQNDQDNSFKISRDGTGGAELTVRRRTDLDTPFPTLVVDGSIQATNVTFVSSRALKTDFQPLDTREILARLVAVPISEWRFKDGPPVRHIGPVAEDFQQAFAEVADGKHISMMDANGIAMAAIQGLKTENDELRAENGEIKAKLAALETTVEALQSATRPIAVPAP